MDETAKQRSSGPRADHDRDHDPVVPDEALDRRVAVARARLREALRALLEVIDDLGGRRPSARAGRPTRGGDQTLTFGDVDRDPDGR